MEEKDIARKVASQLGISERAARECLRRYLDSAQERELDAQTVEMAAFFGESWLSESPAYAPWLLEVADATRDYLEALKVAELARVERDKLILGAVGSGAKKVEVRRAAGLSRSGLDKVLSAFHTPKE